MNLKKWLDIPIKKGKFMAKIFFQTMLKENLKICKN